MSEYIKSKDLLSLPDAPRRFVAPEDLYDYEASWKGSPSLAYGMVRLLAHNMRIDEGSPYARLLFSDAGRNGDPWGAMSVEVNGHVYHLSGGIDRWPNAHDGKGNLTDEGKQMMAEGLRGCLRRDAVDWRWNQEEVDISPLATSLQIGQMARMFEYFMNGALACPHFQSYTWSYRRGVPYNPACRNCTTFVREVVCSVLGLPCTEHMPLAFIEWFKKHKMAKGHKNRSALDDVLNYALWQKEDRLVAGLCALCACTPVELKQMAKGNTQLPSELSLHELLAI